MIYWVIGSSIQSDKPFGRQFCFTCIYVRFSLPVIDKLLTVTLKKEKESMLIESAFHFSTTFVLFFFYNFFFIKPFCTIIYVFNDKTDKRKGFYNIYYLKPNK